MLEEEAAQLRGEMRALKAARNGALEESERKLELAKGEAKTLKEELAGLPSKKDFEAVQHQLKLFQALEFNVDTTNAEVETAAFQKVRKLEATITKVCLIRVVFTTERTGMHVLNPSSLVSRSKR